MTPAQRDQQSQSANPQIEPGSKTLKSYSTAQARSAAGLDEPQWQAFYQYTKEEARWVVAQSVDESGEIPRWTGTTVSLKRMSWERVNATLRNNGIQAVSWDTFDWRMATAVRDARESARSKRAATATAARDDAATARPYDPVRDQ
ncbi:hypothetical protein K491DRAFT_782438 [Lophiostoma macrostomum CBS 122681]|uniref:Uncharacterized protein n=1 Tax=Lophiostoma macrostomum CBS 122681 TaxID=1314788 RepID=A0A6A6SW70_9PLEO|nr:hypothetical protein K491DRAFT_782438 [Lophiostoma macrostomum CBS 122681]